MMSLPAGMVRYFLTSEALLPRILSKPPVPSVPWHWKQLDANRRPLALAALTGRVELPGVDGVLGVLPGLDVSVEVSLLELLPPPPQAVSTAAARRAVKRVRQVFRDDGLVGMDLTGCSDSAFRAAWQASAKTKFSLPVLKCNLRRAVHAACRLLLCKTRKPGLHSPLDRLTRLLQQALHK
jgi:hypothetical protein